MAIPLNLPWNDKEMRLDPDGRADLQPVYQGFAAPPHNGDAVTSENIWLIYKFTYGAGGDITRRQIRMKKSWDNRATIF